MPRDVDMRYSSGIDTAIATFSCPACGQRFVWRPRYAGRALTCRCGHTMPSLNVEPHGALDADSGDTYDIADAQSPAPRFVLSIDDAGVPNLEPAPPRPPPLEATS